MDKGAARTGAELIAQIDPLEQKLAVLRDAQSNGAVVVGLVLAFAFPAPDRGNARSETLRVGDLDAAASQGAVGLAIQIFEAQLDALNQQLAAL